METKKDDFGRSTKAAAIAVAIAAFVAALLMGDMYRKWTPAPKRGGITPQYEVIKPA